MRATLPAARTAQLVVRELPDEVLVYDLDRDKAHCLNKASSMVWKHCDGKTSVAEMTNLLKTEFSTRVDADVVWLAVSQLRRFHLLDEPNATPIQLKVTRRDVVRKYLPAALALPVILSISSPTSAQVASCRSNGTACTLSSQCCSICCFGGQCAAQCP